MQRRIKKELTEEEHGRERRVVEKKSGKTNIEVIKIPSDTESQKSSENGEEMRGQKKRTKRQKKSTGDRVKETEEQGGANKLNGMEQQEISNGVRVKETEEQGGANKSSGMKRQEISNGVMVKETETEEQGAMNQSRNIEQRAMSKENEAQEDEMPVNQVARKNPLTEKLDTMNARVQQAASHRRER